jgi:hypothetical protein
MKADKIGDFCLYEGKVTRIVGVSTNNSNDVLVLSPTGIGHLKSSDENWTVDCKLTGTGALLQSTVKSNLLKIRAPTPSRPISIGDYVVQAGESDADQVTDIHDDGYIETADGTIFIPEDIHLAEIEGAGVKIGDEARAIGDPPGKFRKVIGISERRVCLEGGAKAKSSKLEENYAFYTDISYSGNGRTWVPIAEISEIKQKVKFSVKKKVPKVSASSFYDVPEYEEERSAGDIFKDDCADAAYRMAADKLMKLIKMALLATLLTKSNKGQTSAFKSLLETQFGEGSMSMMIGYSLTGLLSSNLDYRVQRLLKEFRVSGMTKVGNVVLDSAVMKMMPMISDTIKSLPAVSSGTRVSTDIEDEDSFEQQLEEEAALPAGRRAA